MSDLQVQLEPLLQGLFGAFQQPESAENEYVMKCVMRLITFVGPQVLSTITAPNSLPAGGLPAGRGTSLSPA